MGKKKKKNTTHARVENYLAQGKTLEKGRVVLPIVDSSGVVKKHLLSPAFASRLVGISEFYQLYRFRMIKVIVHGAGSNVDDAGDVAMGFMMGTTDGTPSYSDIGEMLRGFWLNTGFTGTAKFQVPHSEFASTDASKWYKTKASSNVEEWEEVQATIFGHATFTSASPYFELQYEVEFSSPVTASLTPKFMLPGSLQTPNNVVQQLPTQTMPCMCHHCALARTMRDPPHAKNGTGT